MESSIEKAELAELNTSSISGNSDPVLTGGSIDLVKGVKIQLRALLGNAEMTVGELFDLKESSIVTLDSLKDAAIDLTLDDKVVATGSLVVVDDSLGVKIDHVLKV